MKHQMIRFVELSLFVLLFTSVTCHADESFMYGKANGTGKTVIIELKLELCSKPPSPMTFVFDDGSLTEGVVDSKSIVLKNKRGASKKYNIESVDGKFKAVDCEAQYTLSKNNSSKVILAIANAKNIEVKKIKEWKAISYEKLDKKILLNAKPLGNMREQMRIGMHLGTEYCSVEWSMEKEGLTYGYKDKSKHRSVRVGAPILNLQEKCQAKSWNDITYISCKMYEDTTDRYELHLTYIKEICVSASNFNFHLLSEEKIPRVWGEVQVDGKKFLAVKQVLSDVLHLENVFLIYPDVSRIYNNYFTPPPSTEINDR